MMHMCTRVKDRVKIIPDFAPSPTAYPSSVAWHSPGTNSRVCAQSWRRNKFYTYLFFYKELYNSIITKHFGI